MCFHCLRRFAAQAVHFLATLQSYRPSDGPGGGLVMANGKVTITQAGIVSSDGSPGAGGEKRRAISEADIVDVEPGKPRKFLGRGAAGVVELARYSHNDQLVAVKHMNMAEKRDRDQVRTRDREAGGAEETRQRTWQGSIQGGRRRWEGSGQASTCSRQAGRQRGNPWCRARTPEPRSRCLRPVPAHCLLLLLGLLCTSLLPCPPAAAILTSASTSSLE